jgi:hypothetical protein
LTDPPATLCKNITDEIHCVKCLAIDETHELIDRSLHELQIEIDNEIPDIGMKNAYIHSQLTVKGRIFVNSKEFRLRFLRFELFDIQKSAIRMLKWLELSFRLFGSIALERPIRISTDFDSHEQRVFRKGYIQLLPVRASGTGRQIISIIPYDEDWYTVSKQIKRKIMMYTCWIIGNDIDAQRKGFVVINLFDSSFPQIPHLKGTGVVRPSDDWLLSVRMSAIHICTPDTPYFRLRRNVVTMAIGSHNRSRLKLHVGTSIELRYILQVYGIPIEFIPMTYTGKIKSSHLRQWLRLRNMIEDQGKLFATISSTNTNTNITITNIVVEAPYLNDVLFKQGDSFTSHPGNDSLRDLVESKVKQLYEIKNKKPAVIKELKKAFILEIMDEIEHIHRGRFVYWHKSKNMSDSWWVLLDINNNRKDQEITIHKIEYSFQKAYSKIQQQQQKGIETKRMNQQESIRKNMATDQKDSSNKKKTKKIQCNNNDSLTNKDAPIATTNQNGGTFLFHGDSLDGKNNNTQGVLNLHDHGNINTNDDCNSTASSEYFRIKFTT